MAAVLKTVVPERVSGVRIPLPPPDFQSTYLTTRNRNAGRTSTRGNYSHTATSGSNGLDRVPSGQIELVEGHQGRPLSRRRETRAAHERVARGRDPRADRGGRVMRRDAVVTNTASATRRVGDLATRRRSMVGTTESVGVSPGHLLVHPPREGDRPRWRMTVTRSIA